MRIMLEKVCPTKLGHKPAYAKLAKSAAIKATTEHNPRIWPTRAGSEERYCDTYFVAVTPSPSAATPVKVFTVLCVREKYPYCSRPNRLATISKQPNELAWVINVASA